MVWRGSSAPESASNRYVVSVESSSWRARRQLAAAVHPEHEDRVEALVRYQAEAPARVEGDVVRVRAGLLGRVGPGLAGERDQVAERSERAIRLDRKHRDRARAVVGADQVAVGGLDPEPHAVLALGRLAVEDAEPAGAGLDRVGGRFVPFAVCCVEHRPPAIEREPRGVDQLAPTLDVGPGAGDFVDPVDVDAVAPPVAVLRRVGADVGEHRGPMLRQRPPSCQGPLTRRAGGRYLSGRANPRRIPGRRPP